jgi:hypothetical protein
VLKIDFIQIRLNAVRSTTAMADATLMGASKTHTPRMVACLRCSLVDESGTRPRGIHAGLRARSGSENQPLASHATGRTTVRQPSALLPPHPWTHLMTTVRARER